ncbi:MAG TPA: glycosyltransferase family 1 protein [Candidatus Moranbacteria bacterium]|nr:glycosyltransferase family 1 protein [Candidatus Moranbacteria bacterium]
MKIGVDIRCLLGGKRTGVEEYTLNLLKNLFEVDKKNNYVLFLNSFTAPKINLEQFKKYSNVEIKIFRFPNKLLNFLFWYLRWPKIDKMIGGVDVFFMPNINFGAFSQDTKLILTIHDLSFEYYPETFSLKRRLWHSFINPHRLCQRSDKIIAVSDSTKSDLVASYGISPQKIEVVSSGISERFEEITKNDSKLIEVKEEYKLPYKFILYLGTIEPRKNITGLIRAYNQLRKIKNSELDKYKLVIAGARGWKYEKIFQEITTSPYQDDIMMTGFICDNDKSYVYNLASLFVYPSFFEGFGFPPLEAIKCGVPTITSNTSSLPEVVGNGGLMIDPDKPDELYKAMQGVLLNKDLQGKLKEKGLNYSKKFNWRKSAGEFLITLKGL